MPAVAHGDPMATRHHTAVYSQPSAGKTPSTLWATKVSSELPPVRLNSQPYQ